MNRSLAAELAAMAAEDQRIREQRSSQTFSFEMTVAQRMEWSRLTVAHTDRLASIVAEHGWPGLGLVGPEGANHAWLLAQHADGQLDRQREFLAALDDAVRAGDAPPRHLAYLTDRVAMNEGRPQRYGTQIASVVNGEGVPWPIEADRHVERRRAEMGLEPLAEYVERWQRFSL